MINGYFLSNVDDELFLVLRTKNPECLLQVIRKLKTMRDKEIKALAEHLEGEWHNGYN
jgi:hypothetical protein